MTSLRRVLVLFLGWTVLGSTAAVRAQELTPQITDRCVRAAVRIVAADAQGQPISTGSGTLVDPRGYVLTNFHVVGHVTVETGVPGALLNPRNRFEVATVTSARSAADPRWVAQVVRADARLDLALLRIVSDASGRPLEPSVRFTHVDLASTEDLRPGSRVWAFGFPMGVRTINVTGGEVTGFQMNARDQVAWLRSDAEFNPGNSGGMLVDASGRLVAVPTAVVHGQRTLEPIELARPVERVPSAWLTELRRGPIDDVQVAGVAMIRGTEAVRGAAIGDVAGLSDSEVQFFLVAPELRSVRIAASVPNVSLVLATLDGHVVRRGQGSIDVFPGDPGQLLIAVVVEDSAEHPIEYELRATRPSTQTPPMANATPPPPANAPPPPIILPPPSESNPPVAGIGAQIRPLAPPSGSGRATIRGTIVDGASGRPIAAAMLIVGRPGLDIGRHLALYLDRRISDAQFQSELVGVGNTDQSGRYEITGLLSNQNYPAASIAEGFRPVMLRIGVGTEGSVLELNAIRISR